MSAVESKRREDLLLEQKQNVTSLRRQLSEKQSKLSETQYSLKELSTATARKIQPLRDQISDVEQRTAEGKGRSSYVIRAPGSGRISMLQVTIGQNRTAAAPANRNCAGCQSASGRALDPDPRGRIRQCRTRGAVSLRCLPLPEFRRLYRPH